MKESICITLLVFFYISTLGQPKERLKNRYKEPNMSYGAPYTTFNVKGDKLNSLTKEINEIVRLIKMQDNYVYFNYFSVFRVYRNTPNPSKSINQESSEYDPLAAHAKNKAFIALIGVDSIGNPLPSSEITRLQNEAYSALENMNTDVLNTIRFHNWDLDAGQLLLLRTRELVQYLQAYDMLKASGRIPNYDGDKNQVQKNPRNRLREFTRNIYDVGMGLWGPARWGDNHSLGFASAIGLASVVLNDAGAANLRWKYRPDRWAEKAHKFLNKAMWKGYWYGPPPLAIEGKISGYAEGPSYYEYFMLGPGIPYLRALHNLIPGNTGRDYLHHPKWRELFIWRNELTTASGFYFGFDNSYYTTGNSLLLTGIPEFTYLPPYASPDVGEFLIADLLALHPSINTTDSREEVVSMPHAGQTIMRMKNGTDNHYFMLLHEKGIPVSETGHEDDDVGSIQLGVNNDMLIFDPGYLGWENVHLTHRIGVHNTMFIEDNQGKEYNPSQSEGISISTQKGLRTPNGVLYNQIKSEFSNGPGDSKMARNISMFKDYGYVYYIIDDIFTNNPQYNITKSSIQFNGNGSSVDSISTYTYSGGVHKWEHPCMNLGSDRWNLALLTAAVNGNVSPINVTNNTTDSWHHTPSNLLTNFKESKGDYPAGLNSRVKVSQQSGNAKLKTILLPYRCNQSPSITKSESTNSASITVHFPEGSTVHLSKKAGNDTSTIINPFDTTFGKILRSNADLVVLSMSSDSIFKTKNYCESYTYFRKAAIENGTFLSYDSVTYINSLTSSKYSAYYELTGKFKYQGNTHIYDSSGFVIAQFYLPEVDSGFAMVARGDNVDSSSYNMLTKTLTVKFTEGKSDLLIELANPCQLSCFFPPDTINIDSVFDFSTGTTEILSHDLQVRENNGLLNISNYSEMDICPNAILYNKDSIILWSPDPGKRKQPTVCTGLVGFNDVRAPRSRINVNDGGSLILLANSVTHIRQGGSVYVAKGGSLIVKSGAHLIIGGNSKIGYGELVLDRGAHLCVEPGAVVSFYQDTNDVTDKNLFWLYHPQNGVNLGTTLADVNPGTPNYYRLIDSSFIISNNICTQLCDFMAVFPPYGINNRPWGFFSSAKPLAKFILNSNYVCPNDSVILDMKEVLNEVDYEFEVCELDIEDSSIINSTCFKPNSFQQGGDNCTEYTYLPSRINLSTTYTFEEEHLYLLKMKVKNGCDVIHDTSQIIYILNKPELYFNYTQEICEGETIASDSFYTNVGSGNQKHIWAIEHLTEATNEDSLVFDEENLTSNEMAWSFDTTITPQFSFPGYYFKGANSYVISLEISHACGIVEYADTINVPFGAKVSAGEVLATGRLLGDNPNIQLLGTISNTYTSYNWEPDTKLLESNTLTPRTNSSDSVTYYTLTAYNGTCSASDSIAVKYNKYLFLGNDTIICKGTTLLIGNRIEESLLFGLLGTVSYAMFYDYFDSYQVNDSLFKKNFGLALMSNEMELWLMIQEEHPEFFNIIRLHKNDFYTAPEYRDIYDTYLGSTLSDYMANFRESFINNNENLKNLIEGIVDDYNSANGSDAFENLLYNTMNRVMSVYETMTIPVGSIAWYKDSTSLPNWFGQALSSITPDSSVKISMFLTTDNVVEYDEMYITVDSTIYPSYTISYIDDSTIYFNALPNKPNHLTYFWSFGDAYADTSTSKSPVHTFSEFNKPYRICITASNYCDSYQFCDTLMVDTTLNRLFTLNKKSDRDIVKSNSTKDPDTTKYCFDCELYLGNNIPNPIAERSTIQYAINRAFKDAKMIFTNTLAQEVFAIPIIKGADSVMIESSQLSSGVYYYYLLVDGVKSTVHMMVVK